jgi:putative hydrolase of the HAD superfamily
LAPTGCYLDPADWRVYPDVFPALDGLRAAGHRLAILSNHVPELPDLVAALGFDGFFEAVFTARARPQPR